MQTKLSLPAYAFTAVALAAPTLAVQEVQSATRNGPRDSGPRLLYYDWLDDAGNLRGGRVEVDPSNPLHAEVAAEQGVGGPEGGLAYETLLDSGPPSNRLDLVFVGDGYTAAQLGNWAAHADAILPVFLSEHPFDDYLTYFNVHRVDVVSNQSGVDNDPGQGVLKDTALDMGFWCSGVERLLCVSVGKANAAGNNAPDNDHVLAVANSSKYGGAGYSANDLATLAGANFSSIEIALHEVGHSLGNLADEYDYDGPTTYTGPEPSAVNLSVLQSAAMAAQQAKWHLWLPDANVNTFQGGGYSQLGIWRPTNNSLMRNLGRPFEQVNAERLVVEIYRIVDPIDAATPPGVYPDSQILSVTPMQPVGHSLDVEWLLDGAVIPGAVASALDVSALGLEPGIYEVTARVVDPTPIVRDPALRAAWLTSEREWTIAVAGSPQEPLVVSAGSSDSYTPAPLSIAGYFLDDVSAVSIGGVPAAIVSQGFTGMTVQPAGPVDPGRADLEVTGPGGTTVLSDAVAFWPVLDASTTGPGGTLGFAVTVAGQPSVAGWYSLSFGVGLLPAPFVVPGTHYGLVLDPTLPLGALTSGIAVTSASFSFPLPNDPTLSGATVHFQAWTLKNFLAPVQSFTNAATLTF